MPSFGLKTGEVWAWDVVLESVTPQYRFAAMFAVRLVTGGSLTECLNMVDRAPSVILRTNDLAEAQSAKLLLERSSKPPAWGKTGEPDEIDYKIPPDGEMCAVVNIRPGQPVPQYRSGMLMTEEGDGRDPMEQDDVD